MASKFGAVTARFYNKSAQLLYNNAGTVGTSPPGDYEFPAIKAKSMEYWKEQGKGEVYFIPLDTADYPIIDVGHLCIVYQYDDYATGDYITVCPPFEIRDVEVIVEDSVPMLKVSGPTLECELKDRIQWEDIGELELAVTTLYSFSLINNDWLPILDATNFDDGDTITVYNNANNKIVYRGTQVGAAYDAGGGSMRIDIDPPLDVQVLADYYVTASDYTNVATNDVEQIMSLMTQYSGWDTDPDPAGTVVGTSHAANGQTIYDLLNATADVTGEWWRIKTRSTGARGAPERVLQWFTADGSDSSGIELQMPSQADAAGMAANPAYGIIISFKREYNDLRVSHVHAIAAGAGDEVITLDDATAAASTGFTLVGGTPPYPTTLKYDSVATELGTAGERWRVVQFSNIRAAGPSDEAKETAANQLLRAAETWMTQRRQKLRFYLVDAICHVDLRVGQTIELYYEAPNAEFTIDATGANALYVVQVGYEVSDKDGIRRCKLVLGEQLAQRHDGISSLVQMAARSESAIGVLSSPAVGTSTGGSSGINHNPVTITSSTPSSALTLSGQALTFSDADIDGSAPGTISTSTTNQTSGGVHTHAVTATTDGDTNTGSLLKTSTFGGLRVGRLGIATAEPAADGLAIDGSIYFYGNEAIGGDAIVTLNPTGNLVIGPASGSVVVNADLNFDGAQSITTTGGDLTVNPVGDLVVDASLEFVGAQSITTTADDLTIQPADDLMLAPSGNSTGVIRVMNAATTQEDGFAAGFLGNSWQITGGGTAEFRKVIADELHVTMFTFEHAVATGRALYITPGASKLTRKFTIPSAIAGTEYIYVEDIPGAAGVAVFPDNSWVLLRYFYHDPVSGHFDLFNIWGQVSVFTNISESSEQRYTFTLRAGIDYETDADSAVPRTEEIERGAPVIGFGSSGSGWVDIHAGDYSEDANTPYIAVRSWTTNPYTSGNRATHVMVGNLRGVTTVEEWGIWAGEATGDDKQWFALSDQSATFNNIPILMTAGGTEKIKIDPTVPSLAIGSTLPTYGSGSGLWAGINSGAFKLMLGSSSGGALYWDGSDLLLKNGATTVIQFDSSEGDSLFTGTMTIDTNGEIVATNTTIDADGIYLAEHPDGSSPLWTSNARRSAAIKWGGTSSAPGAYASYWSSVGNTGLQVVVNNVLAGSGNIRLDVQEGGTSSGWLSVSNGGMSYYSVTDSATVFSAGSGGAGVTGNLQINGYATLDQAGDDIEAILLKNTGELTHGISTGANVTTNTYGSLGAVGDNGGLFIRGLAETGATVGLALFGFAIDSDTTESTTSNAIVKIAGYEGTTPAAPGADDNVIAMRSGGTVRWIMKGDGEIYSNYAQLMTTYDDQDDISLVRAVASTLGDTIRGRWDEFVKHNADDLDRLGIVKKTGFVSERKLNMLLLGALWQLHERVAELEQRG